MAKKRKKQKQQAKEQEVRKEKDLKEKPKAEEIREPKELEEEVAETEKEIKEIENPFQDENRFVEFFQPSAAAPAEAAPARTARAASERIENLTTATGTAPTETDATATATPAVDYTARRVEYATRRAEGGAINEPEYISATEMARRGEWDVENITRELARASALTRGNGIRERGIGMIERAPRTAFENPELKEVGRAIHQEGREDYHVVGSTLQEERRKLPFEREERKYKEKRR